jgi:Methylase involved in ubiquinone/menaquinone biosynthesis
MNHEQQAAAAFDKQSVIFDQLYSADTIIQYKRQRVRNHVERYLSPNSNILELNAGTGEDAVYFAGKGHHVHATDISSGMQKVLKEKAGALSLHHNITTGLCSFTELDKLQLRGPYDMIFSNFAGLNCTGKLDQVLLSFDPLLKPGGLVTLVLLPPFCVWETALVLKGKFKTAFRRFFSKKGVKAHIEGHYFKCWYYKPSYIKRTLKNQFDVLSIEGLCTIVPPSYIEHFSVKYPRWFKWLKKQEDLHKDRWPWKYIGDYYIISLRKRSARS